jgi:hypothetical protein
MKKIIVAFVLLIVFAACKKKTVEPEVAPNPSPFFQEFSRRFPDVLFQLHGSQIEEDLCTDNWLGYMGTPRSLSPLGHTS